MARLWTRPFRPEDEPTADLDGARWAYQAGDDPREMVRVIATIGEREKNQPFRFSTRDCGSLPRRRATT